MQYDITVKVEILAHINFSTLLNFNNITCFNFHDYDIFSIELDDKQTYSYVFYFGAWYMLSEKSEN